MADEKRPGFAEYFMGVAFAVRERADCKGQKVGAVIVVENRIVSTGYNGVPAGMLNCSDGGCHRCAHRDEYPSGTAYDVCICVHAEQNAMLTAARFAIRLNGGVAYTTTEPCFGCLKEMLQAGISQVYYVNEWTPRRRPEQETQYKELKSRIERGVHQLNIVDPRKEWATARAGATPATDAHGMQTP